MQSNLCANTVSWNVLVQGEIEAQGSFEEVSRTPLFDELLEEDETARDEDIAAKPALQRQRTMSIQVTGFMILFLFLSSSANDYLCLRGYYTLLKL